MILIDFTPNFAMYNIVYDAFSGIARRMRDFLESHRPGLASEEILSPGYGLMPPPLFLHP